MNTPVRTFEDVFKMKWNILVHKKNVKEFIEDDFFYLFSLKFFANLSEGNNSMYFFDLFAGTNVVYSMPTINRRLSTRIDNKPPTYLNNGPVLGNNYEKCSS